ncbi:hypothetical protein HDU97_005136 [Phlyctochytrium planicorne]|nr:hypothetical protein HDU97_005136 [Phlyctochytrium planicorne]
MNLSSLFKVYTNPAKYHKVIVAIDLGTKGIGYAYAFCKPNGTLELGEIFLNKAWPLSLGKKTTTAILLRKNYSITSRLGLTSFTTEIEAFGDEAVQRVINLKQDDMKNYLYFKTFKMNLYASSGIDNKTMLKDDLNGTAFPAVKVIGACLEHVKEAAMAELKDYDSSLKHEDVLWVLTVPAIWKNGAKKLMRDAAVVGGLIQNAASPSLMMALEPEAASLVCMKEYGKADHMKKGVAYVLADCGGGTIDVTAHEISDDLGSKVKEIMPASGGDWGSTQIDRAIIKLIEDVLGQEKVREARRNLPRPWHKADKAFEEAKTSFRGNGDVFLPIPEGSHRNNLIRKVEFYNEEHSSNLETEPDSIILSRQDFRNLCAPIIDKTKNHVKSVFERCPTASKLFLVGNFAHSIQLQEALREVFGPRQVEIVIPADPGTAVVIGAVMMGNSPQRIEERVAPASYGTTICVEYKDGTHPDHLKINTDRGFQCDKVAKWFVNIGDKIPFGMSITKPFVGTHRNQTTLGFEILECKHPDVIYTEDTNKVKRLGFLRSEEIEGTVMFDKGCEFTILFGHTEILARVVDANGGVKECTIDYH